jgi:hypothetical protein
MCVDCLAFQVDVHVTGGWPNIGSVLGSVGNSFEDYDLALAVRDGDTSNNATIVTPAITTTLVSGFVMIISVIPSGTRKIGNSSEDAPAPNGVLDGDQAVQSALSSEESVLVDLFGSTLKNGTDTAMGYSVV